MNYIIKHVTTSPEKSISYKKLDLDPIGITFFSNSSFSGNDDSSSQIGYMIFITEEYNNTNPIDYASVKSRRLVRSVLGLEMFALPDACDPNILLQQDLKSIVNKTLKITVLTDRATLFHVMTRNAPTTEKRLRVDIKSTREAYNEEIIDDNIWILQKFNLADAMTKPAINSELLKTLDPGKLYY